MTTQFLFLCTHKSINVSAIYRCSSSLHAYVVQIYSSSLETWLQDKYNLTQCCGSHCCEELFEPLETTTLIPETSTVTVTSAASDSSETKTGQESENELWRVILNYKRKAVCLSVSHYKVFFCNNCQAQVRVPCSNSLQVLTQKF